VTTAVFPVGATLDVELVPTSPVGAAFAVVVKASGDGRESEAVFWFSTRQQASHLASVLNEARSAAFNVGRTLEEPAL